MKWRRTAIRWVKILACLYLVLLLTVFSAQRQFLYHPDQASIGYYLKHAASLGFEPWQNAAGQFIGWKQLARLNAPHNRVLIVHGNAGSAIDRVDYASSLNHCEPCDIYLLEYPGFGPRAGSPSQQSLFQSADEALALLEKDGPLYLVGESLGTGVAAYLAGTHPQTFLGLLLVAPYYNMTDVAQHHMPIFPVRWMLRDKFPSADFLQAHHGPVGVLLGGEDVVIPSRFGHRLYDAYLGPKKLWEIPHAGHNDLPNQPDEWWRELFAFWKADRVN